MRRPYVLVAPNGARRGHGDHPALPVTTEEIIATASACQLAGADGIHLHVRDDNGRHTLDPGRYLETITAIKETAPGLDIQITTEAADVYDVPTQLACLESVRPDWTSIAIGEIARAPELASAVYGLCAEQGTRVQHILYNTDVRGSQTGAASRYSGGVLLPPCRRVPSCVRSASAFTYMSGYAPCQTTEIDRLC